jgi:hypothetical protein
MCDPYDKRSPPCVVLLNGFPGVGKLTIAKLLEAKLDHSSTPFRLIDNHLLINPAVAIKLIRNKAHYALRKRFRQVLYEGLNELKEEGLVMIFTSCMVTSDLERPYDDIDQFKEYVDLAEGKGVPLVMVNIVCDLGTNSERLGSEERGREVGGKTKLVNVDVLEIIRRQTSLLDREQVMACKKGGNIYYFELDTSELLPVQATQRVWRFLHNVVGDLGADSER